MIFVRLIGYFLELAHLIARIVYECYSLVNPEHKTSSERIQNDIIKPEVKRINGTNHFRQDFEELKSYNTCLYSAEMLNKFELQIYKPWFYDKKKTFSTDFFALFQSEKLNNKELMHISAVTQDLALHFDTKHKDMSIIKKSRYMLLSICNCIRLFSTESLEINLMFDKFIKLAKKSHFYIYPAISIDENSDSTCLALHLIFGGFIKQDSIETSVVKIEVEPVINKFVDLGFTYVLGGCNDGHKLAFKNKVAKWFIILRNDTMAFDSLFKEIETSLGSSDNMKEKQDNLLSLIDEVVSDVKRDYTLKNSYIKYMEPKPLTKEYEAGYSKNPLIQNHMDERAKITYYTYLKTGSNIIN